MENISVVVKGGQQSDQVGTVELLVLDSKAKRKKGLKLLVILWVLALFSILIPVAHFVLVPLFLLAGPAVAIFCLFQPDSVKGGELKCVHCLEDSQVLPNTANWPLHQNCTSCGEFLKIYRK